MVFCGKGYIGYLANVRMERVPYLALGNTNELKRKKNTQGRLTLPR